MLRAYAVPVAVDLAPPDVRAVGSQSLLQTETDDGTHDRVTLFLRPGVVEPIISDGERKGELSSVEEVLRRVPVVTSGAERLGAVTSSVLRGHKTVSPLHFRCPIESRTHNQLKPEAVNPFRVIRHPVRIRPVLDLLLNLASNIKDSRVAIDHVWLQFLVSVSGGITKDGVVPEKVANVSSVRVGAVGTLHATAHQKDM